VTNQVVAQVDGGQFAQPDAKKPMYDPRRCILRRVMLILIVEEISWHTRRRLGCHSEKEEERRGSVGLSIVLAYLRLKPFSLSSELLSIAAIRTS
jgi:hypothetical protein